MTTTTKTVLGMTCDHCVGAVRTEVAAIPGVTDVNIDLATGAVTVTSEADFDVDAFAAAVDEAGYEVSTE